MGFVSFSFAVVRFVFLRGCRLGSVIARTPQEFNTGAQIYVGGLEAAHEVLEASNLPGIEVVFDCRNDQSAGRHKTAEIF